MADPVSVVGTAVGVISLGIQVCQGLVSYYEKWKSFDDDIAHLHARIDELRITLKNLEHTLPKFKNSHANIIVDVEKKISSSFNGIRKLEEVLIKCRSSVSANITHQKGYTLVQRTFYPFKKATLVELSNNVTNLEHSLKTSLHSLTLDALGDQHQLVVSTSRVAQEEMRAVKHEIRSINANMNLVQEGIPKILQRTDAIQNSTLNISSTLETRLENLQTCQQNLLPELKNCMEALPQMIENRVMLRLNDPIKQMLEIFQAPQLTDAQRSAEIQKCVRPVRTVQAKLLEKPSLLRDVCDEISHNGPLFQLPSTEKSQPFFMDSSSRRIFKRPKCTCRLSTYSVGFHDPNRLRHSWYRWSVGFSASSLSHRADCELFKYFEREHTFNLKLRCYGGLIAQVVKASVHLRRGAGGFSLSPSLNCIRVVSYDSPAFKLIDTFLDEMDYDLASTLLQLDVLIRKLQELFQDGRASPRDVNPRGDSLLHVFAMYIYFCSGVNIAIDELVCFLENLCRLGVPVNEVNEHGRTCLDEMEMMGFDYQTPKPGNVALSQRMLSLGAEYVNLNASGLSRRNTFWYAVKAAKITELAEATNLNEICKAVLSRSESRLIAAIENHCEQIDEPSFLQLRPLHLSVEWPYGIKVLLTSGADVYVTDQMGFDPIAHAVVRACSKSLDVFEKAGWVFLICERIQLAMELEKRASSFDRSARASIFDSIIKMEVNRRRKLQSLLINYLPEPVYRGFSFCEDELLDEQAPAARAALERHKVSIPACLRQGYDYGTVYHYRYLTVRILDVFWEAGFRDVNGLDWTGHTPLMAMNFEDGDFEKAVEILAWFENKGVDIHEKVHHLHQNSRIQIDSESTGFHRSSRHTVLHYICCNVPHNVRLPGSLLRSISQLVFQRISKEAEALLRRIIGSENQDACMCACSSGGCQALHMILKSEFLYHRQYSANPDILKLMNDFPSLFHPDEMKLNEMFSEIVRLWTFEQLRLTHTCCRERRFNSVRDKHKLVLVSLERDEIDEIQEEEREDLQLLESLLVEFDQQWEKTRHLSFRVFVNEYWWTRMQEVLLEQKPIDHDKIRELGVVLHECNSDSDSDSEIDVYTDVQIEDGHADADEDADEDADADADEVEDEDKDQDEDEDEDQDEDEDKDEDEDQDEDADADENADEDVMTSSNILED